VIYGFITGSVYICVLCCMSQSQSKPVQSPRVLPPLPSSSDNPDVSRVHSRTPSSSKSSSESGVVSTSASNSTDDNLVPAARKPAAISKSADSESLRVCVYFVCFQVKYFTDICECFSYSAVPHSTQLS